jgi:hypothetical protein
VGILKISLGKFFAFLAEHWWLPVGGLVVLLALVTLLVFQTNKAKASDQQPIAFNHEVMVQSGIDCQFCHADARRSISAGMPSVEKCMGCHKVINPTAPEIQKVAQYYENGQPIPWVRVNQLTRFVYFSHEAHVTAAGIDCSTCHGDVGHMAIAQPVEKMTMGWCLSCHEKQPNAPQLMECITCHQ